MQYSILNQPVISMRSSGSDSQKRSTSGSTGYKKRHNLKMHQENI
jgi:hypothetical protein